MISFHAYVGSKQSKASKQELFIIYSSSAIPAAAKPHPSSPVVKKIKSWFKPDNKASPSHLSHRFGCTTLAGSGVQPVFVFLLFCSCFLFWVGLGWGWVGTWVPGEEERGERGGRCLEGFGFVALITDHGAEGI
jgi:hypothetical protein